MKRLQSILRYTTAAAFAAVALVASALDPSYYAANSVLAEGKWAKIKVNGTGMHVITDAELKELGFNDPSRVRIYGTSGRMEPEGLSTSLPDDLPLLPSVRTKRGVVFYGTDYVTWSVASSNPYTHIINPYTESCYYFVSDRDIEDVTPEPIHTAGGNGENVMNTFTAHLLHERDLVNYCESGAVMHGEDFRSNRSQTFDFSLPGNTGDDVRAYVAFDAAISGGAGSVMFTANGERLPSTNSDKLNATSFDKNYFTAGRMVKDISNAGNKLSFGIDFSCTGVIKMARLNFIEVFYERKLQLDGDQLWFYNRFIGGETVELAGATSDVQIWDVTEPWAPQPVDISVSGGVARFTVLKRGYREFIAFRAENVTNAVESVGNVANQNLHALETPDMVIITTSEFTEAAERIADLHRTQDGMTVLLVNPNDIYNEFSGGKIDVTAFRKFLKMLYDRGEGKLRYCILMGKPTYDHKGRTAAVANCGYTPLPIWQSRGVGDFTTNSFSTDDYIAQLDDVEAYTFSIDNAPLRIAVGRIPARNAEEAMIFVEKLEKHVLNPEYGPWRNKMMIIADDGDAAEHMKQGERVVNAMNTNENGQSTVYDKLYLDAYKLENSSIGKVYPQATARMLKNYNDGVIYTNYIGHAGVTAWGHEHLWTWPDIQAMSNRNLTFIYGATCEFLYWDLPGVSGGEHLLFNPDGGVVGMIAASRKVFVDKNGNLNESTSKFITSYDEEGRSIRLGDAYIKGKNNTPYSNNLRYAYMGDPAMRLVNGGYKAVIEKIKGVDITRAGSMMPELTPLDEVKLTGRVFAPNGQFASDFDGTICLQLYDAENVITTNGNNDGVKFTYNDRSRRLAAVSARVEKGVWTATMRIPLEIEGNYSPARITAYIYDKNGNEGNGATEHLYVYGDPAGDVADIDGPVIEHLYMNHEGFASGDVINANAVMYARFSDPSGINVSDAGIGHKITVALDGKEYFNDIDTYYVPDPDDAEAGTVRYPMSDLTPGRHELVLTVWDNASNMSRSSIEFVVAAASDPKIVSLDTDVNPATTDVTFRVALDRPNTRFNCTISVYDLSGRVVWSDTRTNNSGDESVITRRWDLCNSAGARVPRGIYLYRAYVETPEGTYSSESKKLAVTAP